MWKFRDDEGAEWEIVVGRESWGGFVALFVPGGDDAIRQASLDASSQAEANRRVQELGRPGWLRLLARSRPKDLG